MSMPGAATCGTLAEDHRQLLMFDAGTSVVLGLVLCMILLILVSMGCGYFYAAWATEAQQLCRIIRLTRQNEELKGQIQRLSSMLENNKRELDGYKASFDRLEMVIMRMRANHDEPTAIVVQGKQGASG